MVPPYDDKMMKIRCWKVECCRSQNKLITKILIVIEIDIKILNLISQLYSIISYAGRI